MSALLAKPYNQYQSYKAGEYITFNGSNYYLCLEDAAKQQSPITNSRKWQQVFNSSGLTPSGVTAGTYGDATNSAQITVDINGIVTAAVDVPIAGGAGTVTSVSVVSANGFAGTVATATITPAITISTTITGILIGNGTAVSAATNADITGKLLTGYVSGAGVVAATDSILQAIQKLNGNTSALVTGVSSVNSMTGVVPLTGTANRITISVANVFDIGTDVVTLTGAQALSNKTGLISQWTNDVPYLTSTGITPSAVTAASNKIVLAGTPATAALQAFSIDVDQTKLDISTMLGTLQAARGGTNIDTSASTGVAQVLAGVWSVSPTLANNTLATTQAANDNSTKVATTAYVDTALANVSSVGSNLYLFYNLS